MKSQISVHDIVGIVRRRMTFFIIPFVLIAVISVVGAYILPARYESYTTILIQREEMLNPLVQFQMAVTMAQGDALSTFNEIVYSRSSLVALLDSLGNRKGEMEPAKVDDFVDEMRGKIATSQRGSDSFRITVADRDPVIAQKCATVLAQLYIQTSQKATQQGNEEAIKFYEQKVDEYGKLFGAQQRELLSVRQGALSSLPQGAVAMNATLDRLENELKETDRVLTQQQQTAALLQTYADNIDNPGTVSQISALEAQGAVMYLSELKLLSVKYNQLLGRFTARYPDVQNARQQLLNLLGKSSEALAAEIEATKMRKYRQLRQRDDVMQNISKSLKLDLVSDERRTDYIMYKEMYDGMKLKLEQARVSKDLGDRGANKFVILDPAQVPTKPTKPNKKYVIAGGIGIGALVGVLAVFLGEYFDPTIRRRRDIEVYEKPIVAYLP